MRKGIAFVLLAVGLLGLAWFAHSKVAEARREAAYRAAIAPFERDLRLGLDRAEVQTYLASRKVDYHPVTHQHKLGRWDSPKPLHPTWFAHVFLIQPVQPRSHDSRPSQIANHVLRIFSVHHWQTADIVAQHLGGGLM